VSKKPSFSFWSTIKALLDLQQARLEFNSTLLTDREICDTTCKRRNAAGALASRYWKLICCVHPRSSIFRTLKIKIYWQLTHTCAKNTQSILWVKDVPINCPLPGLWPEHGRATVPPPWTRGRTPGELLHNTARPLPPRERKLWHAIL